MRKLRLYLKWKYLRFSISKKRKLISEKNFDDDIQKKAVYIVQHTINKYSAELLTTPNNDECYIKHNNMIIIFNRKLIIITKPNYKYDTIINDRIYEKLSFVFLDKIKEKQQKIDNDLEERYNNIIQKIQ